METYMPVSLDFPLKPFEVPIVTRDLLEKADTDRDRLEALVFFASHHGLFSDRPELRCRTLGE